MKKYYLKYTSEEMLSGQRSTIKVDYSDWEQLHEAYSRLKTNASIIKIKAYMDLKDETVHIFTYDRTEDKLAKELQIKTSKFINWYFFEAADQDINDSLYKHGMDMALKLKSDGNYSLTAQEIFDTCEPTVIPLNIVEGFEIFNGDIQEGIDEGFVNEKFTIKLI